MYFLVKQINIERISIIHVQLYELACLNELGGGVHFENA